MAEVGTVMEILLMELQRPDVERLRLGDYNEVAKMWMNRGILLKCCSLDIDGTDEGTRVDATYTLDTLRGFALSSTPCLRGLMQEASTGRVSSKHDEMVKCCSDYYQKIHELLGEACLVLAPDQLDLYKTKFN